MNQDILISIYGIFQIGLKEEQLLGSYGQPLPIKGEKNTQPNQDIISLYKWLSEALRSITEATLNERKEILGGT